MCIDNNKQINLVSLKNIDIWPIYGPKSLKKYQLFHIRAYVSWLQLNHFLTHRTKFFYGNSGDYYLLIGVIICPHPLFAQTHTHRSMSPGPQNPTEKLTHLVDLLGHLLSRNHVSNFSDLGPPPPPPLKHNPCLSLNQQNCNPLRLGWVTIANIAAHSCVTLFQEAPRLILSSKQYN